MTWTPNGLECEADVRHGESLVKDFEFSEKDSVVSPGIKINLRASVEACTKHRFIIINYVENFREGFILGGSGDGGGDDSGDGGAGGD